MMSPHLKASLLWIATLFVSALAYVFAKLTLSNVPAFTFNWLQITCAILFLISYTFLWRKEKWPTHLSRQQWLIIAAIGITNFTLVRILFTSSLEQLPVTTHAYLLNFVGLVTMFLSIFLLSEKPFFIQFFGAILALSGITVYFEQIPAPEEVTGIMYVAAGVFFLALTNNFIRRFMVHHDQSISVVMLSTLAICIGGLPVLVTGVVVDGVNLSLALPDILTIIANGVFALALNLIVMNKVLRTLRSYEASVLASSSLIFVALLAIPIVGETLSTNKIIGIIILLMGIALNQFKLPITRVFNK